MSTRNVIVVVVVVICWNNSIVNNAESGNSSKEFSYVMKLINFMELWQIIPDITIQNLNFQFRHLLFGCGAHSFAEKPPVHSWFESQAAFAVAENTSYTCYGLFSLVLRIKKKFIVGGKWIRFSDWLCYALRNECTSGCAVVGIFVGEILCNECIALLFSRCDRIRVNSLVNFNVFEKVFNNIAIWWWWRVNAYNFNSTFYCDSILLHLAAKNCISFGKNAKNSRSCHLPLQQQDTLNERNVHVHSKY